MNILLSTACPAITYGGGMARAAYELAAASARLHQVLLLRPGERSALCLPSEGKAGLVEVSALDQDVILLPDLRRKT